MTTTADMEKSSVLETTEPKEEELEHQKQQDRLNALLKEHECTWDGPCDPQDPYNWSSTWKITVAIIVSLGQLVAIMTTSIVAPSLSTIAEDLHMKSSEMQVTFSIFVLGLAFAPFLIAALSEMYGRKSIWVTCNLWYILWNSLCPVGHSSVMMIVGRFMAGSGASVGTTLTSSVLTDMYRAEHRGKSLAIATFIPYLGPAIGPILGGVISQNLRWEWSFWILSLFEAVITLLGLIFFTETYTPTLLRRKAAAQRNDASSSPSPSRTVQAQEFYHDLTRRLKPSILRPMLMLTQRPVVQVVSFINALAFGIYCLMLSTYASLWTERYNENETISSLNYIAIAIGTTIATQIGGHTMDWIYRNLKKRNKGQARPEYRAPFLVPGVVLVPIGLFWYGWSADQAISWVMVDAGAAIFTCGSFIVTQGMLAYLLDEMEYAASANAASRMLSNICGFAFPIFAPQLYSRLHYGWGNSVLAFVFIALGVPTPLLLWLWGFELRALGKKL
ncbi:hypothetical protein N7466_002797 [Penicillium verhagenii]|uniref:uncharacterized protein n=1 Tax=Penicillium verhagenii TaxID=1562060 RepID=UPI002545195A|nr:uncharacterized protein N7466_002797 [Penicillium verhagenii]KAJ5939663.1 hypothetical protein N7466_002797 [Penicillium verhagenii]